MIRNLLIDALSLSAVGIPIFLIKYLVSPARLGFFCSDTSLRLPYHPSTVTTPVNVTISYGLPIIVIVIHNSLQKLTGNISTRRALHNFYNHLTVFLMGVFSVQCVILFSHLP